jgi:hypothetical protein
MVRGWISVTGKEMDPCALEDVSVGGAKILLLKPDQPPDAFKLFFSKNATNFRNCVVRWRTLDSVGVQFADAVAGPTHKFIV